MVASFHNVNDKDEDDEDEDVNEENGDNAPEDTPENKLLEDNDIIQVVDDSLVPSRHWTRSQQAQQKEKEFSLVEDILSDDDKHPKSQMEVKMASKEKMSASSSRDKTSLLPDQKSLKGEGVILFLKNLIIRSQGKKGQGADCERGLICQTQH